MTTITIHNLEEPIAVELRSRAAKHGCSMEEEILQILRQSMSSSTADEGIGSRIHRRFAALGGVDLPIPRRNPSRPSPDFSEAETK